jgi:hypothetical protein
VQQRFGGAKGPFEAPEAIVVQAADVLARAGVESLYARIDGVVRDGVFVLMEVEVTEPDLFWDSLGEGGRTYDAYVDAVLAYVEKARARAAA